MRNRLVKLGLPPLLLLVPSLALAAGEEIYQVQQGFKLVPAIIMVPCYASMSASASYPGYRRPRATGLPGAASASTATAPP